MIPFPLPPNLARLHDVLEHYSEGREKGFFLAEQDRNGQAQAQPVLMFITPQQLAAPKSGRHAPAWMGEVVVGTPDDARLTRYAEAGVREYWRVFPARIEVYTEPQEGGFASSRTFAADEPVESTTFPGLSLCARDLAE